MSRPRTLFDAPPPPVPDGTRLRVLIVAESFLPQVNGVTASVCRVLEHAAAEGHTAAVIAASGPESYAGARVHRVAAAPLPGYPEFRVGVSGRRRIEYLMRRFHPDVVHLASPFVLGATAARAAARLRIPTVAIYQTDVVGFARRYGMGAAVPAVEGRLRRLHGSVGRTLAPSTASLQQLAQLGIPRVHRWERGIDLERFAPAQDSGAEPRSRMLRIGYVGRLAREKNLDQLSAVQDRPGTRLVIVGDGPIRVQLQQALPRAQFLGEVTGDALAALMASLDLFVHPGTEETFCQSAQEALASGVPVVGPAAGGLLDRVQHGDNGLLYSPDDPGALRRAVVSALAPAEHRRLSGRARTSVLGRSWNHVNAQLLEHYRDVIGAARGGRERDRAGHRRSPVRSDGYDRGMPQPASAGVLQPAGRAS